MTLVARLMKMVFGRNAGEPKDEDDGIMPGQDNVQIIVGLGNPGARYADTRHNAGFFVVDELARRLRATGPRTRFKAEIAEVRDGDRRFILVKPQTFMNESGLALREVVNWYRVPLDHVLIVVDDLDQPFGQLRLRAKGSAGGHNGLKSIFQHLATQDIARLRIGIGRGVNQTITHVLSRFSPEERAELDDVVRAAADAVMLWSERGPLEAMNLINGADKTKGSTSTVPANAVSAEKA
ncbi:MAG: aminoacyl-tRNA hydrolase [Thermomicrobiales bacterium]